ncbi:MAG: polysaccharide biosynthesis/export family protein [Bacteroidales bacterium]|nr:polysaccharide biosynthesis/export family protein [Bacteroidales bacterium]
MKYIKLLLYFAMVLMVASCVTPRRVNYLQDMTQGSQIELENRFEARIAPYDELSINVVSYSSPELAAPFNNPDGTKAGYLVDVDGNIDFPYLGKINVAGLTRLRMQDTLTYMLKHRGYISDAFVTVRFSNFKIFYLGGGTGKVINIPNERCTFLEALAMLGDLGLYTRRDHIAVMREIDGRMVMRYLDPRSSDVFNDPFFMLQQNDFIITDTYDSGIVRSEVTYLLTLIGTVSSMASLLVTFMLYRKSQ